MELLIATNREVTPHLVSTYRYLAQGRVPASQCEGEHIALDGPIKRPAKLPDAEAPGGSQLSKVSLDLWSLLL